jgi:putative hydrolase of the HAD superfamily
VTPSHTPPEPSGTAPDNGSSPVRAILLDAGNTLVFVDRDRVLETYRLHGVEADETRFLEAEFLAREVLIQRISEGGTGTETHVWRGYFETLFQESGVPADQMEGVGAALVRIHHQEHLWTWVEPGTGEALESLRDAGYRLGVISNADGRIEALLESRGLREHFEFVIDSQVVGLEKPDPRIFMAGVERMGVSPRECLYVGDLYPVDVLGARGAGLQALLLDPMDRLSHYPVDRVRSVLELPRYLSGGE